jgi:hypothetical protein
MDENYRILEERNKARTENKKSKWLDYDFLIKMKN